MTGVFGCQLSALWDHFTYTSSVLETVAMFGPDIRQETNWYFSCSCGETPATIIHSAVRGKHEHMWCLSSDRKIPAAVRETRRTKMNLKRTSGNEKTEEGEKPEDRVGGRGRLIISVYPQQQQTISRTFELLTAGRLSHTSAPCTRGSDEQRRRSETRRCESESCLSSRP